MTKKNGTDHMMQAQQARAQNLKRWREQRLHEETLPSGLEVLLRDVDLASVAIEGNISNTLIDLIISEDFQKLSEEEAGKQVMSGNMTDFNALLMQLIKASLVDPLIGDVPDNKHILYSELTFDDRIYIFNFLSRDAQKVRSFRDESTKSS
jgi:hypothetical protein